jgi:hypothetical protein
VIPTSFPAAADGWSGPDPRPVIAAAVMVGVAPSKGLCLCCGADARWQVRPVSHPPELPKLLGRPATLAVPPAIKALRAIHPHLHGASAGDLAAILRGGFPKSPRGPRGQYQPCRQPAATLAGAYGGRRRV